MSNTGETRPPEAVVAAVAKVASRLDAGDPARMVPLGEGDFRTAWPRCRQAGLRVLRDALVRRDLPT